MEDALLKHLAKGATRESLVLAIVIIPLLLLGKLFAALARGIDRFHLANCYQFANG